ncbi:pyrroloquinoline quinone biosynthesis protein PqqB [Tistlia consotensis]|uniref:pyrroloquinoline quinone biosynthesis protein PqqB n=1 Tax=Tistlia consotensis TaxID=1321365 RepID=UPI003F583628
MLGAAAGGGFPQWNSNSPASRRSRQGDPAAPACTQSSIAVSRDGRRWVVFNASPDIRQQINDNPPLHPAEGVRHSPISSVVLTNADVDHVAGLLTLRESQPFSLYATSRVLSVLAENTIFNVLNPDFVVRRQLALEQPFEPRTRDGEPLGLTVEAFAVPGKVALYKEDASAGANFGSVAEDTVGLRITETGGDGRSLFYLPGCAALPAGLKARLKGAALLLFDGTLWRDDEMLAQGAGVKTGQRMGHLSMAGPEGTIAGFADLGIARKVFIHINNTNPVLLLDSPERAEVEAAGWTVARDGMELEL